MTDDFSVWLDRMREGDEFPAEDAKVLVRRYYEEISDEVQP